MLFPFYEGEDLPLTNWNTSRDTLQITFGENSDQFYFAEDENGRTQIEYVEPIINSIEEAVVPDFVQLTPNPTTDKLWINAPTLPHRFQFSIYSMNWKQAHRAMVIKWSGY